MPTLVTPESQALRSFINGMTFQEMKSVCARTGTNVSEISQVFEKILANEDKIS